jgi:hypothetical protein
VVGVPGGAGNVAGFDGHHDEGVGGKVAQALTEGSDRERVPRSVPADGVCAMAG